jgi:4-amino-4-deoxy-L-arabinose transferase-like glycosyltransferase
MIGLRGRLRLEVPVQAVIAVVAAVLLFWGLTDRYLWQDEAATAVLATRMLKYGRPLAYDGVNLITTDVYDDDDDAIARMAADPKAAVAYHLHRGEFKPDTTWKWQPWGLFAVAAASFKALGQTTLAARLPFALAALATVLLLFRLVRRYSGSLPMAILAAAFLVGNPYWILHARQCRYCSLSSLFLTLTLMGYARWQWGGRGGAAAFVAAAWCWFQVDYGTVWPVYGVLFLDAFLAGRNRWRRTVAVGAALAAAIAPFFYYYELWGRAADQDSVWKDRFLDNLYNMNEFVAPALIVLAAAALLIWRWKSLAGEERRLAAVAGGIIVALAVWIPSVAAFTFLRYAIIAAPAAALLTAWLVVRACGTRAARFAWPAAALLIATPWASLPLHALAPPPDWAGLSPWVRSEFSALRAGVFSHQADPNRIVIEWLRKNASPSDEILINYEDIPLMFYLPNPIRGGIPAFRVEDDARTPPRFVVLRHSVEITHWPLFERELQRYQWAPAPVKAPDMVWGNNPDPIGQDDPAEAADLYIARRIGR